MGKNNDWLNTVMVAIDAKMSGCGSSTVNEILRGIPWLLQNSIHPWGTLRCTKDTGLCRLVKTMHDGFNEITKENNSSAADVMSAATKFFGEVAAAKLSPLCVGEMCMESMRENQPWDEKTIVSRAVLQEILSTVTSGEFLFEEGMRVIQDDMDCVQLAPMPLYLITYMPENFARDTPCPCVGVVLRGDTQVFASLEISNNPKYFNPRNAVVRGYSPPCVFSSSNTHFTISPNLHRDEMLSHEDFQAGVTSTFVRIANAVNKQNGFNHANELIRCPDVPENAEISWDLLRRLTREMEARKSR